MPAKSQTNWPPEKLEEWARPALAYPELVEIARTTTSNNEAKNKALAWVTKTREDLAQACRWLRILRLSYPGRFERMISQNQLNSKLEGKKMNEKKVSLLVDRVETVASQNPKVALELHFVNLTELIANAMNFLSEIRADKGEDSEPSFLYDEFYRKMIEMLEEKFGILIRICWNCAHYRGFGTRILDRNWIDADNYAVFCHAPEHKGADMWALSKYISAPCGAWVLRKDKIKSLEGFPGERSTEIRPIKKKK